MMNMHTRAKNCMEEVFNSRQNMGVAVLGVLSNEYQQEYVSGA